MLKAGIKAPNFTLKDKDGKLKRKSDEVRPRRIFQSM